MPVGLGEERFRYTGLVIPLRAQRLAVAISGLLEERFGRAGAWLISGGMCTGVALVLIPFYLAKYPPLAAADLTPTSLEAYRYRVLDDALEIESVDRRYHAQAFWQPEVTNDELQRALTSKALLTLWLYDREIFGLDVGGLTVPKSAGLRGYAGNRRSLYWLIALCLGLGAAAMSRGLWSAAAAAEAEDAIGGVETPAIDAGNEARARGTTHR